ncbi:hypothetical protein [Emticicia oligotrophica]|uniref:hypothetical protein n=1 Tax=Emticicia oligotrophica TaxID=312279 RepID=UPI00273CC288|nr:hypothetical protein [Emticicia oligotrophica]
MQFFLNKNIAQITILLFFLVTVTACKNPLDGFILGFKEPINKSTLRVQFSLPENGQLPQDLDFRIVGQDADKIVTNLNSKNFKISKEGLIVLAVEPLIIPSVSAPIKFTLVAESKAYTKIIKEFIFKNAGNYSLYFPFVKREAPGVINATQQQFDPKRSTSIQIASFNKQENISISVAENTLFYNSDNNSKTDLFDIVVNHYSSANSKSYLPAGGVATNPVDVNDKPLAEPFDFLQTAALFSLEMSTDKDEVIKKFSKPLNATIEIAGNIINPQSNVNIASNDKIGVFSYDTDIGLWKEEGETYIKKNEQTGKFEIKFEIPHVTYWIAGWKRNICRTGPSFISKSLVKDLDIVYYAQLVNVVDNKLIRDYYISANDGATFNVSFIPKVAEKVKFRVFDYNNFYGGNLKTPIVESPEIPLCGVSKTTIDLSKITIPKYVELDVKLVCPQGQTLNEAGLPSEMKIQFSEPDKNLWRDIGVLTRANSKLKTYKMQVGQKFDLRASTDGGVSWPYVQKNYLIDKQNWSFRITMKDYCK